MTINPLSSANDTSSVSTTNRTTSPITEPLPPGIPVDKTVLSPLARLQNLLQQIHDNRTERFSQITSQISDKLKSAATKAQNNGNSKAAEELAELANQFQTAAQTGQPPSLYALTHPVQALAAYHHQHPETDASGSGTTSPSTVQTVLDAAQSVGLS
jgi:hypothetical protein